MRRVRRSADIRRCGCWLRDAPGRGSRRDPARGDRRAAFRRFRTRRRSGSRPTRSSRSSRGSRRTPRSRSSPGRSTPVRTRSPRCSRRSGRWPSTRRSPRVGRPFGLPGMAFAIADRGLARGGALLVLLRRREGRSASRPSRGSPVRTLVAAAIATLVGVVHRCSSGRPRGRSGDARPRGSRGHRAARHRRRIGGLRRDVRRGGARLADRGTALYRRDHGRRAPPAIPAVTAPIDPGAWDALVEASDPGSYLQLTAWAR